MLIVLAVVKGMGRRIDRSIKEERRAVRGAKGEELIGSILEELSEDFLVFRDLPSPSKVHPFRHSVSNILIAKIATKNRENTAQRSRNQKGTPYRRAGVGAYRRKNFLARGFQSLFTLSATSRSNRLDPGMEIWFYGFMKTTLEIPDELFREMKAAAALRGMKLKDFVTIAISDQLARSKSAESAWSKERLPPPPKVAKTELRRIHELIERESEHIDLEDWQQ